jgi:hypothetical protein
MTVNAKLPKTPQSRTAGASDLAVDSLDNKIPIGRARNWVAATCPIFRSNGEQRAEFQGAAVRKASAMDGCGCSKSGLRDFAPIRSVPTPQSHLCKAVHGLAFPGCWSRRSAPPRTRQISRACGSSRSTIPPAFSEVNNLLWPAMACANDTFGSQPLREGRRRRA